MNYVCPHLMLLVVVLDPSPWGLSPPITAPTQLPKTPSQVMPIENIIPSSPDTTGVRRTPSVVRESPRPNQERIIRFPAGRAKSQKWSDWMTEQHFQDGLQRRSWIRDQSVVEPGRLPAPPLYGASRELQLRVGSSMPTIYAQRLTPTDIKQLQDENQKLRNQVLDRMFACPICDEEFETYDQDKIRAHCRLHQQQLEEVGQCPSCGDPQWVFMTNLEQRSHFATHQDQNESAKIKNFYRNQHCPVCDMDLSRTKPEQVIRHCLEHSPGQIQFCDRCGLNEKDCNVEELNNHHHKCRLADDRQGGDPEPVFCSNCGLNITCATLERNQAHLKQCREGSPGKFCTKCGLNETGPHWEGLAVPKHDSHCKPPSGFTKKFCEKCGIEVGSLDATGTTHHQKSCRQVERPDISDRARLLGKTFETLSFEGNVSVGSTNKLLELKKRQDVLRTSEGMLNALKATIDNKEQGLDAREEMLVLREADARAKLSTYDNLKSEIEGLKQSRPGRHYTESFLCPLENSHGVRCNRFISLKDDAFDVTIHYDHKLSEHEQQDVEDTVNEKLRATIQAAQRQVASDTAFIGARSHLLSANPTSAPTTSARTAKTTAMEVTSEPLQHHRPTHQLSTAKHLSLTPGRRDQEQRPPTVVEIQSRESAKTAARRRRASVSEQVYKPLVEEESSAESDVPPPPKKKGRPAKVGPVTSAETSQVTARKRKQPDVEEELPVISKKRTQSTVPSAKSVKVRPPAEREQVDDEGEVTVAKKSLHHVMSSPPPRPPVKKKVRKAEDTVYTEATVAGNKPKTLAGGRKRRKTRGRRGPAKG